MKSTPLCSAFMAVVFLAGDANASPITIDEYRYEVPPFGDAGDVLGTIDASVSGNILTLVVKNTMTEIATNGSNNLLTALGLTLPGLRYIIGGTVLALDGTEQHFNLAPVAGKIDISQEWGYTQPPTSGHLKMTLTNEFGSYTSPYTYGLAISTLTSDIGNDTNNIVPYLGAPFAPGSVGPPAGYDGPDFGVYSLSLDQNNPNNPPFYVTGNGQEAVGDYITIRLTLNSAVLAGDATAFIDGIDDNAVALVFGSANNAFTDDSITDVPEPASLALLGLTCVGGLGLRFRRNRGVKQDETSLNA